MHSLQHVPTPAVAQLLMSFHVKPSPLENLTEPFALGLNAISRSNAWEVARKACVEPSKSMNCPQSVPLGPQ